MFYFTGFIDNLFIINKFHFFVYYVVLLLILEFPRFSDDDSIGLIRYELVRV
jgi:hypothetical protein